MDKFCLQCLGATSACCRHGMHPGLPETIRQILTFRAKFLYEIVLSFNMSLLLGEMIYPTGYCPIDRGSEVPTV